MILDAHQHFWQYDPLKDGWITEKMQRLRQDFLPDDLQPLLLKAGVTGTIAVQAAQTLDESRFLLELANNNSYISGVVGWIDLMSSVENQLDIIKHSKLVGIRHIVQAEKPGYMLQPEFIKGVIQLGESGKTYDLLIHEGQLEEAYEFLKKVESTPVVIDHFAKPDIKSNSFDSWSNWIKKISVMPHVMIKSSGLITEADWNNWSHEQLSPYFDLVLENFGTKRIMYGSDWPVCLLSAESYQQNLEVHTNYYNKLTEDEQQDIFYHTAKNFYKL